MFSFFNSTKKANSIVTIAFYNVENLFDTKDDPTTFDDHFTTHGKNKWNLQRYSLKIKKLGSVISQLGIKHSKKMPAIIGLVEVENIKVMRDLTNSKALRRHHLGIVHYDSPDERGIDVALLYNKQLFELISSETHPVLLENEKGDRDYTRDILKVTGKLQGELVHVLVNHWPSRREGVKESAPKRGIAAVTVNKIVENIRDKNYNAKIIIMGDFNDNPESKSIQLLIKEGFFNPMKSLLDKNKKGSVTYEGKWNLFDQILFSNNFLEKDYGKFYFKHAEVFNKKWLKVYKGKLKGSPFRTYIGPWYQGGFSDHFPVYAYLKKSN